LNIDGRFADWMDARTDPRKDLYMKLNAAGTDWVFHESGDGNLYWAQNNTVVPLQSYVELALMRAEALQGTGAGEAEVSAALAAGIAASMQQVGLDSATYGAYVAAQSDLSGLSDAEKMERIIEEAYSSYYGFSFLEVWTNYRRTGYPALSPSSNGVNGLNPSGVIPRRFPLPIREETTNATNYQAALDRQGGGLLDVDTWANQ
jgi:hypothetical protein